MANIQAVDDMVNEIGEDFPVITDISMLNFPMRTAELIENLVTNGLGYAPIYDKKRIDHTTLEGLRKHLKIMDYNTKPDDISLTLQEFLEVYMVHVI